MALAAAAAATRPLRIGMVGGGTVGGGVYEIVMDRLGGTALHAAESGGVPSTPRKTRGCIITKVCVRDLTKPRTFHINEAATELVSDVNSILQDDSIDMVVEVMGGTTLARTVVLEALKSGKSVVTANKALIAEHLDEIHNAVKGSSSNPKFAFEAAVCGGIPIIETLQSCYAGDVVHEVMGIANGTTNYMLGKMEMGADYNEVLKEAQDLGYAEADPTADVEGHDVRAKIAILAKLAFGTTVPVDSIPCMGITGITPVDFEYAKLMGCTIKLVGTAGRLSQYGEHDGALSVYVSPKVVPNDHLLASARGAGNAIVVNSANLGTASYTGPGAGRFPTANSVVADICRVAATHGASSIVSDPFPLSSNIALDNDYSSAFFLRISFQDGLGIIRTIGELAERHGVSINSILQNPIKDHLAADFVVTTEECKLSQIKAMCDDIELEEFATGVPLCMPLMLNLHE
jgi:homoserine dehydrogenase